MFTAIQRRLFNPLWWRSQWIYWRILCVPPLILVTLFTGYRVLFLIKYHTLFAPFSEWRIALSMIEAIRFDAMIIAYIMFLPLLLVWGLYGTSLRTIAAIGLGLWMGVWTFVVSTIHAINLVYYEFVNRHLSFELHEFVTDWWSITLMIANGFPVAGGGLITLSTLLAVGTGTWVTKIALSSRAAHAMPLKSKGDGEDGGKISGKPWLLYWTWRSMQLLLLLLLSVTVARGGLQPKAVGISAAFSDGNVFLGHLRLNPVFTGFATWYMTSMSAAYFTMKPEIPTFTASAQAQKQLLATMGRTEAANPKYPLFINNAHQTPIKKKNVVLIVLESFPAHLMQSFGEKESITPHLDQLARQGRLFTNFHAVGTRSTHALATIFTSFPNLPNLALIGGTFEQSKFNALPYLLRKLDYDTLFVHGSKYQSYRIHPFAKRSGFARTVSRYDFPDIYPNEDSTWGIFDEYMFARFHDELTKLKPPFFGMLFTITTHPPFNAPADFSSQFSMEDPAGKIKHVYAYTDSVLGQFFEQARRAPYWKDTIFVITADHFGGFKEPATYQDRSRLPLIIIDPSATVVKAGTQSDVLGGQVDLAPTILDLLDISVPHHFVGRSLLKPAPNRHAPIYYGDLFGWIEQDQILLHNLEKPILITSVHDAIKKSKGTDLPESKRLSSKQGKQMTRHAESYLQTLSQLLLENRLMP